MSPQTIVDDDIVIDSFDDIDDFGRHSCQWGRGICGAEATYRIVFRPDPSEPDNGDEFSSTYDRAVYCPRHYVTMIAEFFATHDRDGCSWSAADHIAAHGPIGQEQSPPSDEV